MVGFLDDLIAFFGIEIVAGQQLVVITGLSLSDALCWNSRASV